MWLAKNTYATHENVANTDNVKQTVSVTVGQKCTAATPRPVVVIVARVNPPDMKSKQRAKHTPFQIIVCLFPMNQNKRLHREFVNDRIV
jgi:hypothetical protein